MQKILTKNKWLTLAMVLILPFIGLTALIVSAGTGQVIAPPLNAKTHNVDVLALQMQTSYQQQTVAYGRVEPAQRIDSGFELAGTLQKIWVDEGQSFVEGQLLAQLDTKRLEAGMLELNAALQRAEAEARLARLSEKRVEELVAKKLESTQRQDETRESTLAAQALVTEIKARQTSLQVDLDKSKLVAPFSGTVIANPLDQGTVVAAGQTVLRLQQASTLEARIALPADDAAGLKVDGQYNLLKGTQVIPARIKSIAAQRSLDTRTVDIRFDLIDSQIPVLPGDLLAHVYSKEFEQPGVWVPRSALSSGVRGLWTLFTVAGEGSQSIASKTVEVLHLQEQQAYVRGALKQGDLLVINGAQRLVPEQVVQATKIDAAQLAMATH